LVNCGRTEAPRLLSDLAAAAAAQDPLPRRFAWSGVLTGAGRPSLAERPNGRLRRGLFIPSDRPSGSAWEARWFDTILTNSSAEASAVQFDPT
jgi:hypothetical protein